MANKPIMSATGTGMQPYRTLLGEQNYGALSGPKQPQSADPYGLVAHTNASKAAAGAGKRPFHPTSGQGGLGYQTGFNADGQAVNVGNVMDRLGKEGRYSPQQGSATGMQGAADLSKSLSMNDAAQMRRGIEKENAQQNMQNQVTRSELMQSGLSNQAKIYGDMAQRENDQVGLAAKLQEAMIRNRFALAQALLSQSQG